MKQEKHKGCCFTYELLFTLESFKTQASENSRTQNFLFTDISQFCGKSFPICLFFHSTLEFSFECNRNCGKLKQKP